MGAYRILALLLAASGCTVTVDKVDNVDDTGSESLPSWCEHDEVIGDFRGVHTATNNGSNFHTVRELRSNDAVLDQYLDFVARANANWIGVSIALQYDSALDTVLSIADAPTDTEPELGTPTYSDEDLNNIMDAIEAYEARNGVDLHVYWTVGLEPSTSNSEGCDDYERDLIGWSWADALEHGVTSGSRCSEEPTASLYEEADWFWGDEDDPDVVAFFESYTEHTVHFAELAASRGVEMFSVGTEGGGLFRTSWFDDSAYPTRIQELVDAVRDDGGYGGYVTYDMLGTSFVDAGDGNRAHYLALWDDVDFDVIGVSAYFPLLESEPSDPDADLPLSTYEAGWDRVFEEHLSDVAVAHAEPIVFLEFGYAADYRAGYAPDENMFDARTTSPDGIDHGEVAQALIYEAFLNRRDTCNDTVEGGFVWGNAFATDAAHNEGAPYGKGMGIRAWEDSDGVLHELSENAFTEGYGDWR